MPCRFCLGEEISRLETIFRVTGLISVSTGDDAASVSATLTCAALFSRFSCVRPPLMLRPLVAHPLNLHALVRTLSWPFLYVDQVQFRCKLSLVCKGPMYVIYLNSKRTVISCEGPR